MSSLTFKVIDTQCEAATQSFFPPNVKMTTRSTTRIATVRGFSEYSGFESTPPKKYKKLTWDGTSEQMLFDGPTQIAGAKYDYFGFSEIDSAGHYISLYSKQLSEMCTAADNLCMGLAATGSNPVVASYNILGWIGAAPNQMCPGTGLPYSDQGDKAIGTGQAALYDSTPLSSGINFVSLGQFAGFKKTFVATSSIHAEDISSGSQADINVLAYPAVCGSVLSISHLVPPLGFTAVLNWDHNYSATLSDEYTDAEALANARVILGNGSTAQNLPRTTGFVSSFTSVVYTLHSTNLIAGTSYVVSVELADLTAGTSTIKQYGFTASDTTHDITDSVPTPSSGHSLTVRKPSIVFA